MAARKESVSLLKTIWWILQKQTPELLFMLSRDDTEVLSLLPSIVSIKNLVKIQSVKNNFFQ